MSADTINNNTLVDPIGFFPDELASHILSYLSPVELGKFCRINNNWKRLGTDHKLWARLFASADLNFENLPENPKSIFDTISVKSLEELTAKVTVFVSKVTPHSQAEFICFFLNRGCFLQIRMGNCAPSTKLFGLPQFAKQPDLIQHYVFAKKLPSPLALASIKPATKELEQDDLLAILPSPEDVLAGRAEMPDTAKLIGTILEQQMDNIFKSQNFPNRSFFSHALPTGQFAVTLDETLPIGNNSLLTTIRPIIDRRISQIAPQQMPQMIHHPRRSLRWQWKVIAAVIVICVAIYFY